MSDESPTTTPADAPAPAVPAPSFIDAKRRGFLQGTVLAGGAAASGATLAHHDAGHDETVEPAEPASGYRETDHVRDYYAAARF